MDFPLEQDQEGGQAEARCVSYLSLSQNSIPNTCSCFDLIFLTTVKLYSLYSNNRNN